MVGVRVGSSVPWHGNVIYEVNGSTINIAYVDKFMKNIAIPGCIACVKYSNDYFSYYFSGTVKSVSTKPPEYISVEIDTTEEIINNRLFPRYDVSLKASLKPVWDDHIYQCTVTVLSYSGAEFICPHEFHNNELLRMSIFLPDNVTAELSGKVLRRKDFQSATSDYIVQFIECDIVSNKLLTKYFSQLEDEASEIYRRYVAVIKSNP